jgi:hypothetical protein
VVLVKSSVLIKALRPLHLTVKGPEQS